MTSLAILTPFCCVFNCFQLYYTTDFGQSFVMLQSGVKSVMWSSGEDIATHLYVERREPTSKYLLLLRRGK